MPDSGQSLLMAIRETYVAEGDLGHPAEIEGYAEMAAGARAAGYLRPASGGRSAGDGSDRAGRAPLRGRRADQRR
jgi:hypothetical protein